METGQHPSFPQPDDRDSSIWRYMDFPKFEWLLEYGRLYMPTADQLGDHLEGSTPQAEIDWWNSELARATNDSQRDTINHNLKFFAEMSQAMRKRYFVSCWHSNRYENNVMWGAYTRTSRSVSIRTTYSRLRSSLPSFVHMGVVRYIDYSSERFSQRTNMFEWIMHKESVYSGENEVRAVTFPPVVEPDQADFTKDCFVKDGGDTLVYAPVVPMNELIMEIIIHPDADGAFSEEVSALCEMHGLIKPTPSRRKREAVF